MKRNQNRKATKLATHRLQRLFAVVAILALSICTFAGCGSKKTTAADSDVTTNSDSNVSSAGDSISDGNSSSLEDSTYAEDDYSNEDGDGTSIQSNENILMKDNYDEASSSINGDVLALGSHTPRADIIKISILDTLADMPDDAWDVSEYGDGSVMAWLTDDEDVGDKYDLYIAGEGGVTLSSGEGMFMLYTSLESFETNGAFHAASKMNQMFYNCSSLTTLNASSWDMSEVTDMSGMFCGCSSLTTLDVSSWDVSNVTNMCMMFLGCKSLTTLNVSNWDVFNVTNMDRMFEGCESLTTLDVSNWDVSNVSHMYKMFYDCTSLAMLDVSNWDISSVDDMGYMFYICFSLTTLDTSNWIIQQGTITDHMFDGTIFE